MDVGTWLAGLGIERYAEAFRANDVGLEALAELTDDDLRELGVSLGHRRVLLKAIRERADATQTIAVIVLDRIGGAAGTNPTGQRIKVGHDLSCIGDLTAGECVWQDALRVRRPDTSDYNREERHDCGKCKMPTRSSGTRHR